MLPDSSNSPILFFDGVCNLCNGFVQFIIRHDKKGIFRFSSLQSNAGQGVLSHLTEKYGPVPDSLVLLYKGKFYTRADAALEIAKLLGGGWKLFSVGYIMPRVLRNKIYDFVARNRYKWYGKRDECMMPTKELKSRFLD